MVERAPTELEATGTGLVRLGSNPMTVRPFLMTDVSFVLHFPGP
jgi:hypothetical protein